MKKYIFLCLFFLFVLGASHFVSNAINSPDIEIWIDGNTLWVKSKTEINSHGGSSDVLDGNDRKDKIDYMDRNHFKHHNSVMLENLKEYLNKYKIYTLNLGDLISWELPKDDELKQVQINDITVFLRFNNKGNLVITGYRFIFTNSIIKVKVR